MGYSCPVCGDPQADDSHLANHLAFTALVRGGDHEAWLDETVPDWESMDEEGLAAVVTDHAEQTEYPQVFEDTTEQQPHDHQHTGGAPEGMPMADLPDDEELSEAAADALEEARELTRQRHENSEKKESE
jgi:hypothetical protein